MELQDLLSQCKDCPHIEDCNVSDQVKFITNEENSHDLDLALKNNVSLMADAIKLTVMMGAESEGMIMQSMIFLAKSMYSSGYIAGRLHQSIPEAFKR